MSQDEKMLIYGKISWLWSNSELHREWPITLQSRFVLPAIIHNQYYLVEKDGYPVAYCSWALVDKKTEEKYILDPNSIEPELWNCGDRLWFCDWISPFSSKYTWALRAELNKRFPNKVARAIRTKKGHKNARVSVFVGQGLSKQKGAYFRHQYFNDAVEALSNNPDKDIGFTLK